MILLRTLPFAVCLLLLFACANVFAGEIFSEQTGKDCEYCHVGEPGELTFTPAGEAFVKNFYEWPVDGDGGEDADFSIKGIVLKKVRRLLVSLHAVFAVALVGGLLFLGYASPLKVNEKDIEPGKRRFIWISLAGGGISGLLLTGFVYGGEDFWTSDFGFLLAMKFVLTAVAAAMLLYAFLVMPGKVGSAREKVRAEDTLADFSRFSRFSPEDLGRFNGLGGKRALIAFKGRVYDVTGSEQWKAGLHQMKHRAGNDLTGEIKMAPHSESILERCKVVGEYKQRARLSGSESIRELDRLSEQYVTLIRFSAILGVGAVIVTAVWR